MNLLRVNKGQNLICLTDEVIARHEKGRTKRRRWIHSEHLIWKPPVFTRDQLRFGW